MSDSGMQLSLEQSIYQEAVNEVLGYWEGHTCEYADCTFGEEYLSKAYDNPNPTSEDIGIIVDRLVEIADYRGIEEDEPCDEDDDEGRGFINMLLLGLAETVEQGN